MCRLSRADAVDRLLIINPEGPGFTMLNALKCLLVWLLSTKKRPKSRRPSRCRNTLRRQLNLTPNSRVVEGYYTIAKVGQKSQLMF